MRLRNFFLMLKQGIKGVFKFKIQLIIIALLSFVATFILSVSLSTQEKLEESYDKIVKPVKRFAYSGSERFGSTVDSTSDMLLLPNLVNNMGTASITIKDKDKTVVRDDGGYNYVFENFDGKYVDRDGHKYVSFLTKGTDEFIKEANASENFVEDGSVELNNLYLKNLFQELNEISILRQKNVALSDISEHMGGSQTIYSPVGLYTYNNQFWFKRFVDINATPFNTSAFKTGVDNLPNDDIFKVTVYAVSHLTDLLSQYVKAFNSANPYNFNIDSNSKAIAFLFGKKIDNTDFSSFNWIVDDSKKMYSLNLELSVDPNNNDDLSSDVLAVSDGKNNKTDDAIWYSGLRGISNPFINMNGTLAAAKANKFTSIFNWNNYKYINLNIVKNGNWNDGWFLNRWITFKQYNFYGPTCVNLDRVNNISRGEYIWMDDWTVYYGLAALYRSYSKLNAEAVNFVYSTRKEASNFDSENQINYRTIQLNDYEDYNFTILEGSKPGLGEIAINEQFANKNNIEVGDNLKIMLGNFQVAAIVSDALSYLPGQDTLMPVPNAKVSAFVFADKQTMEMMNDATKTSSSTSDDERSENYIYFLTDKLNSSSDEIKTRFNEYVALSLDKNASINQNYLAVKQFVASNGSSIEAAVATHKIYDSFDNSGYRYSFTVQPDIMKIYDSIVFTAAGVIAAVAMAALIVSVKKAVDFNSKQIGILKALGESPEGISVSYISYSLIIGLIVVPVAWVLGIAMQIPFSSLFGGYFSLIPNTISWNWLSFVIAFVVMGVVSCLIAYMSSYILTKRPIIHILNSSVKWGDLKIIDWLKNKPLRKSPFSVRFSLTLTSSGDRQILLMSIIVLLSSFLMSLSLALPAVATEVNSSYYKAIKYSNKFDEIPNIGNAPLSKNAISYWDGQEYADKQFVHDNWILSDGYYKDPSAYLGTINNSSLISPYLYDQSTNKFSDSYVYLAKHLTGQSQEFMPLLGGMIGNNMFTDNGNALSVGMIDAIYGTILHSVDDLTKSSNEHFDDKSRADVLDSLNGTITTSLPKILEVIYKAISPNYAGDLSGSTWKEQILSVLYGALPSFVKNYVQKSPSRQDQYAIAFQNEIYIPGQETLATKVTNDKQSTGDAVNTVSITGLDRNQNSIIISNDAKDAIYLSPEDKQAILDRFNIPVNNPGIIDQDYYSPTLKIKLYDGSKHEFTIPALANNQAESAYNFSSQSLLKNWTNNIGSIQFKSKDGTAFFNLPRDAWQYDDTDFVNSLDNDESILGKAYGKKAPYADESTYDSDKPNAYWTYTATKDGKYYLDPAKLNNGKLTYATEFNDGKLANQAYMFKEFKYGSNGVPEGTYLRPYYQYKNFKLMIPEDWIDKQSVLWNYGPAYTQSKKETTGWYDEIDTEDIPQNTFDAYKRLQIANSNNLSESALEPGHKWLVINPYDVSYFSNKEIPTGISMLITGPAYWYRYFRMGNSQFRINMNESINDYLKDEGAANNLKINLLSVGNINSYNDKLIVVDSDLANLLMGYSDSRAYQYNYQTFKRDTLVKAGETNKNSSDPNERISSEVDRWYPYSEDELTDNNDFLLNCWANDTSKEKRDVWQPTYYKLSDHENVLEYAPHNFYNLKLSNVEEPLNLSSQVSFTTSMRTGQYSIILNSNSDGYNSSMINGQELLSTIRGLANEIAGLAIAIGAMLIIAIIITAALLIMMTGDIYITQYKRFIVLLRALGYSNASIVCYTFGTVTIMAFADWLIGTFIAWMAVFGVAKALWAAGIAIPVGITWWPILLSLAILAVAYFGSLTVSSAKTRKVNPSTVLTATAE